MRNEVEPLVVIQESRDGINPSPTVLNAGWPMQWIGTTWPAIAGAGSSPTAVYVQVQLPARDEGDYVVNQNVAVCAPPDGNGVPSTWLVEEEQVVEGVGRPGDIFRLPVPLDGVMGEAGWGVTLNAAVGSHDNLRAVVGSVRLVVEYAVPEPPEPQPEAHQYTIVRKFMPGDSVTLNVVNDGRKVAEMRFIID